MRRRWRLILLVAVLLALTAPGLALAHPEIVRSEPEAGAQLATAPTEVRITFSEALETAFSDVQLFDTQGQPVEAENGGRAPDDPTALLLPLPELKPGLYTVVWQTIGSDGHKIVGNFVFTILESTTPTPATPAPAGAAGAPTPTPPPIATPTARPAPVMPPAQPAGPPPALAALLRAVMLMGALAAVGGWAMLDGVLEPSLPADAGPPRVLALQRWRRAAGWSLLLLLGGAVGFALAQTATAAGQVDGGNLRTLLLETRLGQALLARIALAAALAVLLVTTKTLSGWRVAVALLLGGGLLLTFSLAGHASAQRSPLLPVLFDWVHLAATSVWVGGLVALTSTLPTILGALQTRERVSALAGIIVRFSTLALWSVVALTMSGTYATLLHLTAVSDLWTSDYGRALLLKLLLFGGLIALGAYNMWIIRPKFVAWAEQAAAAAVMKRWQRRFQGTVRAEVVLAALVIGAVGFLTNTAPPRTQAQRPPTPIAEAPTVVVVPQVVGATARPGGAPLPPTRTPVPSKPFAETKTIANLQVGLEVQPATLGKNMIRVTLRDAAGTPVDVQKVALSVQMLDMDMGVNKVEVTPRGSGVYEAPAGWFSMVGNWGVKVEVRRIDADDLETDFRVPVGG